VTLRDVIGLPFLLVGMIEFVATRHDALLFRLGRGAGGSEARLPIRWPGQETGKIALFLFSAMAG
jgi:hypothetical protein